MEKINLIDGVIYCTTNLINGKKYIGLDSNNNPEYLGSGTYFKRAIKKYGKENFKKQILENCSTWDLLLESEIYWIDYFGAVKSDLFYNICFGGECGFDINFHPDKKNIIEKTKKSLRLHHINNPQVAEEAKKKRKQTILNNPDIILKAAEKRKKTLKDDPTIKQRISEKRKIREAENPNLYIGLYKPILCYNLKGEFTEKFNSATEAREKTKCLSIIACCKGKVKRSKQFMFRYFEGEIIQQIEPYKHSLKDKKRPKEVVEKIASKNRGRKNTAEQSYNCGNGNRNRIQSQEEKNKRSKTHLSLKKKFTQEHIRKYADACMKSIFQYDLEGNFITEHKSVKHAAEAVNVHPGSISSVAGGKQKTTRGFKFFYHKLESKIAA